MINKIKNGANWLKLFTGARDRKYTILVISIKTLQFKNQSFKNNFGIGSIFWSHLGNYHQCLGCSYHFILLVSLNKVAY